MTKVKTQYPKTLEEAIKAAQIYDDSNVKSPTWGKSGTSKINAPSKEDSTKNNGKKPKGARGPLTSATSLQELAKRSCVSNA